MRGGLGEARVGEGRSVSSCLAARRTVRGRGRGLPVARTARGAAGPSRTRRRDRRGAHEAIREGQESRPRCRRRAHTGEGVPLRLRRPAARARASRRWRETPARPVVPPPPAQRRGVSQAAASPASSRGPGRRSGAIVQPSAARAFEPRTTGVGLGDEGEERQDRENRGTQASPIPGSYLPVQPPDRGGARGRPRGRGRPSEAA